jgi:hypothetical protein
VALAASDRKPARAGGAARACRWRRAVGILWQALFQKPPGSRTVTQPDRGARGARRTAESTVGAARRFAIAVLALAVAAGAAVAAPAPKPATPAPPPVEDLKTRTDLRGPFNLERGKVRVVAFLSPSCSHCIVNATNLQQILTALPSEEIEVFAVWLQILETDNRAAAAQATTVLPDRRVQHYWDPKRLLNHQLLDAVEFDIQVRFYDVFLLYDRQATWTERLPRPGFWMHEYRGAPGPVFDPTIFAAQVRKALRGEALGASD